MSQSLSLPVNLSERAGILDALRGFAILGIFLDNVFSFTGYGFFSMAEREALPTFYADGVLGALEMAFVHGKFYSIFSLLFGIGFSIILVRNQQRGINPLKVFYRRLFILLLIGSAHLFLLWEGDILLLYALIGCLLPLFRKCSDKSVLILGVALIASPIVIDVVKVLLNARPFEFINQLGQSIDKSNGLPGNSSLSQYLYRDGAGWKEWRNWQASAWAYRFWYLLTTNRIPKVLGMFLFGLYAGRKMIYANLADYTGMFKKLRKWGFMVGIPGSIAMTLFEFDEKNIPNAWGLVDSVLYAISVVPLCLAYVSAICLFWIRTKGSNKWQLLAPVGRMALTNYLMQTILSIIIFYGLGFGVAGKIGPAVFFPIAFAIYIGQVIYSNWWFKHFNYGPMEWLWRQLTYGKRLPFRKVN
ncbi:DUF418 domain-containing protein [Mucilaginibacter sp.]|uniref:DUF418 domain-containing protein n=1 Tax=Mucilaginibacter sp. TaxID=1882438 RepID=UPI00326562F5